MIQPYRIKHKPTGLYYIPVREIMVKCSDGHKRKVKSNLSKTGKIYFRKQEMPGTIANHFKFTEAHLGWPKPFYERCVEGDFEIEYINKVNEKDF